jgi:hypothetical protein
MSDYHDTCKRERKVGYVLSKLDVPTESTVADLLIPGIRGKIDKVSVDDAVDWFQGNPAVQRCIDDFKKGRR